MGRSGSLRPCGRAAIVFVARRIAWRASADISHEQEHVMIRRMSIVAGVFALLAAGLVGCQKPNMEEMMKPPMRPVELDQLNAFVGKWEGTWEMKMAGEEKPMTGKGTDVFAWDADKWVLTTHSEGTCGEHKMTGTGLWVYDSHEKDFKYGSADNYGMIMVGSGKYDAKTQTWHMKGTSHETIHGQQSVGEGTLKFIDANTMEWHWTEWDSCLHLMKFMEMTGTSHRK
jgi:hypothetical protein